MKLVIAGISIVMAIASTVFMSTGAVDTREFDDGEATVFGVALGDDAKPYVKEFERHRLD